VAASPFRSGGGWEVRASPVWGAPGAASGPPRRKFVDLEGVAGAGAVLIIPVRSAVALYSLHSCHPRYSLINNKNSRRTGAPAGCQTLCRALYKQSPIECALLTFSPLYRAGSRGSGRCRDLPEVTGRVNSSGPGPGPGEAGRGAAPRSRESRGGGAGRRAGRKAQGVRGGGGGGGGGGGWPS
jgi:hypothetical protein